MPRYTGASARRIAGRGLHSLGRLLARWWSGVLGDRQPVQRRLESKRFRMLRSAVRLAGRVGVHTSAAAVARRVAPRALAVLDAVVETGSGLQYAAPRHSPARISRGRHCRRHMRGWDRPARCRRSRNRCPHRTPPLDGSGGRPIPVQPSAIAGCSRNVSSHIERDDLARRAVHRSPLALIGTNHPCQHGRRPALRQAVAAKLACQWVARTSPRQRTSKLKSDYVDLSGGSGKGNVPQYRAQRLAAQLLIFARRGDRFDETSGCCRGPRVAFRKRSGECFHDHDQHAGDN